ncbi:hypothetical protein [Chondrinema litorale]|uniref:hypothetical protein n=1 Tax=Chondrinema litorale TaxID=2994555 RepID=UPI002543CBEA|nr:hypothetical protein [Chondrinema litorale]UZR92332.1 hypothetical protein OQ292_10710 [Chondrinema litorale]
MKKQETYDLLNDLYETYQYLMTKIDHTKELLENANNDPLVDFEKQRVKDIVDSIVNRHDEIQTDIQQLKNMAMD